MSEALYVEVGLTEGEYEKIVELLGREPNHLELELFGVMWSEHCSYKSSRVHLGLFPTEGERVLVGPGENAGVLDIGDGWAVALRAESHNHPSAIEPFQGAATGVGGILRDIFTMGARPVALLDSLRFGPLTYARNKYLFRGVVAGISHYGNSVGVPTVGGEVFFDRSYQGNPLVNVMAVGVLRKENLVKGQASGVGNEILIVGAKTGRDGIHGASLLASREFNEAPLEMRPAVQVGDPFMGKLLIEATLEALETGAVVGVNDLGAAGLTSAASETASRAGTGVEIDVSLVPRREEGMTPDEVMLSESQERMLFIVEQGKGDKVREIFRKWQLDAARIGFVTDDGMLRIRDGKEVVAQVPAAALTESAPVYERPMEFPKKEDKEVSVPLPKLPDGYGEILRSLLGSPNLASKAWVYNQYDYMVRTDTVMGPGGDAAIIRIKGTDKGIAISTDGNSRYTKIDPFLGGAMAVAEAARNVVCVGGRPIGLTNCLNFGNPENKEIMGQFRKAIEGMALACRVLGIPVTGGNVSLYNETQGENINPTPLVGMVGLLEDVSKRVGNGFTKSGNLICLIGENLEELGGSEYLSYVYDIYGNDLPVFDLEREKEVQEFCLRGIDEGLIKSAHDVSDGGLAIAIAEMIFNGRAKGAAISMTEPLIRRDSLLFGEAPSRIVVEVEKADVERVRELGMVPFMVIGEVKESGFSFALDDEEIFNEDTIELEKIWREALKWSL